MIKFKYMKLARSIIIIFLLTSLHLVVVCQVPGIYDMDQYLPFLKNKKTAIVVNQTSMVNATHLLDTLIASNIDVRLIFSPEHGFSGQFSAGEYVYDSLYFGGIPIISLYGDSKKIKDDYLRDIDVVVFDIQDIGVRFYTYISTLHYVMEGCARNNVSLILLDRPNPHVNYVDGPVLESEYSSFVGMHKVPIVYGMTIGEYALMINGEKWLSNNLICDLYVVKNKMYSRSDFVDISNPFPSPNLRTMNAIFLYPSLCLFEGTVVSVGRGTDYPFELYGVPFFNTDFSFTPISNFGAKNPKHNNTICYGFDLRKKDSLVGQNQFHQLSISYLLEAYRQTPKKYKSSFFNNFFNKLAGNSSLQKHIVNNSSEKTIRLSWQEDIHDFMLIRKKYLLYD